MSEAPTIVLAGNPNSGKTTLFNRLTGLRQKVGNYPGVTVERRSGTAPLSSREATMIDLPGTYSLVPRSRDEAIAFEVLSGQSGETPALAMMVVDASNLDRNLYLALQVIELGRPVIIALNMVDVAREAGLNIDDKALERELGVPVVPVVATTGEGLEALRERAESMLGAAAQEAQARRWTLPEDNEADLAAIKAQLPESGRDDARAAWILSSVAMNPGHADAVDGGAHELDAVRREAETRLRRDPHLAQSIVTARYEVAGRIAGAATSTKPTTGVNWTDRLDRVLLHRVVGPLAMVLIMAVVFQSIFAWADPMIDLIEGVFAAVRSAGRDILPDGVLTSLLLDGVVGGVGSVLVFIPQIAILFLFIAILEDSGYLARAAYIMDRLMAKVGLHGKAFVPLLSGFACAVPAIMATRTIESPKDRLVTILVTPLMSCSARLPVYALIISALFSKEDTLLGISVGALLLLAMYFLSVFFAVTVAGVLKRTLLVSPTPPLVLELPPYRRPDLRTALRRMTDRSWVFVKDAGSVILALSIVLWALLSYPKSDAIEQQFNAQKVLVERTAPADARDEALARLESERRASELRNSYAGRLGRAIEPVIEPLGYDWKIGVGLVASFAAREVLVSTLGMIYGIGEDADEESVGLREALKREKHPDGRPVYTPLVGLSLMIFFLLACQCMSTVAVVKRETASWRWPLFMIAYMTLLAWVGAFVVYQGGRWLGFS